MDLRADIGDQCKYGGIEEGQANPLKNPHHQKWPKRKREEIGNRGECKKEGTHDHKGFFRYS